MSGSRVLTGIGLLSLAVLVLMLAGPVCAAESTGAPSTMAAPGAPGAPAPAAPPASPAPAEKSTYFSGGGGTFTAHESPTEKPEIESVETYREKVWRANYIRAMKKQRAEKAALKKVRLRRLYPVSALASIQAD